jgi:competence protein ComEC
MSVHFYDAGQALAALVLLPDGRRILVDAGDSPTRPDCDACRAAHDRIMKSLARDLRGKPLEMIWITHPHSDHAGGAADVLTTFGSTYLVDNGRDLEKPSPKAARQAATASGTHVRVVDPEHPEVPLVSTSTVKLTAVVPRAWPSKCVDEKDTNACSIGLRIDACRSSVFFTGDAPGAEEDVLSPGEITLLQVGHHGSATSTTAAFIDRIRPKYAVIPSAKPYEGMNDSYCHPRTNVVATLTKALGGPGSRTIKAFDGAVKCEKGNPQTEHWLDVPTSDRLFSTARDGEVLLTTSGDGVFVIER